MYQFFQTEIIWRSPAVLEEMAFLMGSPPPSLHPAGCHTEHQFSNLKEANKEPLVLDSDTTPEFTIARVSSFILS